MCSIVFGGSGVEQDGDACVDRVGVVVSSVGFQLHGVPGHVSVGVVWG